MYHKAKNCLEHSYYDTIGEMPLKANVYYPDSKKPVMMDSAEMFKLSSEGWRTIMHSCNYGCCDHWTSEPLSKRVNDKFNSYYQFTDREGKIVGYNRREWAVRLTRDKHYFHSEVWNS